MRDCPACQRPVRKSETACPFCSSALPAEGVGGAAKRLGLGAAVVVAVSGCPAYGVPPSPYVTDSPAPSVAPTASPSTPIVAPAYGAPPPKQ